MDDAGAAVFVQRREKEMRCMENDCAVTEQVREPLRFAEFARGMLPYLETGGFHAAYYRVLEAFARGRVSRLIVAIPPLTVVSPYRMPRSLLASLITETSSAFTCA